MTILFVMITFHHDRHTNNYMIVKKLMMMMLMLIIFLLNCNNAHISCCEGYEGYMKDVENSYNDNDCR